MTMSRKHSVVLYADYMEHFKLIESDSEFRRLIESIFDFSQNGEEPHSLSPMAQMAFSFVKAQVIRDQEKYNRVCERNKNNGSKGGRPKKEKPSGFSGNPNEPKKADNDNDNDNDTDINIGEIVSYLNQQLGTHYKSNTVETVKLVKARSREGFTLDDFKTVIDGRIAQWGNDPQMSDYLRPSTLFSKKFESYLQSSTVKQLAGKHNKQDCSVCDYGVHGYCNKAPNEKEECTSFEPYAGGS